MCGALPSPPRSRNAEQSLCPDLEGCLAGTLTAMAARVGWTQDLKSFEQRITAPVLPNGLTLLVCERPDAPVFSYSTFIDAGDVNNPWGESGLAHMFEHLAFKGTREIGSKDYPDEKMALEKVEKANDAYEAEYLKPVGRDPQKLAEFHKSFLEARASRTNMSIPNQFTEVAQENGATGLNASTGLDETEYFWSMPENRWSCGRGWRAGGLLTSVPREFYKERNVVMEERRMRLDSNPIGRMVEQFLATAYVAHNYGRSGIGWPSEVAARLLPPKRWRSTRKYYVGSNIVVAVVGDVKAAGSDADAGKVFQQGARRTQTGGHQDGGAEAVRGEVGGDSRAAQPFYIEGYHRPSYRDPDDAVFDAIQDIMSNGRVSRLYRSLVREQQIAAVARDSVPSPATSIRACLRFMRCRCRDKRRTRCARRFAGKSTS